MDNWGTNSITQCQRCKTEFDGCEKYCDECMKSEEVVKRIAKRVDSLKEGEK